MDACLPLEVDMCWRRWWRGSWLMLALSCAYLLAYSWQLALVTLTPIDAVAQVRTTLASGDYATAAAEVRYFRDLVTLEEREALVALAADIDRHRDRLDYQFTQLVTDPLLTGTSDEVAGQAVALVTSLTLWGDLRDLTQQGLRYLRNETVDDWVVTLSLLGLAASATQVVTLGTSTPAKVGVAFLAVAHKAEVLTAPFRRYLVALTREAVTSRSLQPVVPSLQRLDTLVNQVGVASGLRLMRWVRGPGDLQRLATLTRHFGTDSRPLLQVGGDAVLRLAHQVERLGGPEVIKAASRYGPQGIRTLGLVGPVKFVKYGARLAKIGYQLPWLQWLAKAWLRLPTWVLVFGIALGVLFGLPWPWHKVFS